MLTILFSCAGEDNDRVDELTKENADLKRTIKSQDSVVTRIGVGAKFVNSYLDSLARLEQAIQADLSAEQNDSVIADKVKSIARLAHLNRKIIEDLRSTIGEDNLAAKLLLDHVVRLDEKVKAQEMSLAKLKGELGSLGGELNQMLGEYAELQTEYMLKSEGLDKYKSKAEDLEKELSLKEQILSDKENELSRVYYFFGSKKELSTIGITKKSNLFSQELNENINLNALNKADSRELGELDVPSTSIKLLSDHPENSYELKVGEHKTTIVIKDSGKFWSITKALIIQTN
ncbi:MAG: hypothetical protein R2813_04180 [Flavobacteriales bacterium]